MTLSLPVRAFVGFLAAVLSVLIFHQGVVALLHVLDIPNYQTALPYPMRAIPPWGIPAIVNLCFWGGMYGVVFGMLAPRFTLPFWVCGLIMGLVATLVGFFVVSTIKGTPVGGGWMLNNWVRSILINGVGFGLGLGLIYPVLARLFARRA
ncbi:MAG: hypothetical protein H7251_16005 [Acetobacteraceae bacterium]|nr:hypothetical protein [Acetobacteraceae bacterium]